jgi:hypothetical protein
MKQLRIACLGDYTKYFSYYNYGVMEGAIRNGAWFRPISIFGQSLSEIKSQIEFFKPHILFTHCIFDAKGQHNRDDVFALLRWCRQKAGIFNIYHAGDARPIPRYAHPIDDIIDIGLLNASLVKEYSGYWKIPCYRWPYMCLYQEDIASKDNIFTTDIAFTGSLSNDSNSVHYDRTIFINKLSEGALLVRVFPNEETGNTRFQTAELASSANMILGKQMVKDLAGYVDVRPFQYIGAGAIYLHDKAPQVYEYFEPKVHYLEYDENNYKSIIDLHKHYVVDRPDEGDKIRRQGFEYCQRFHSTKERVKKVIEIYKEFTQC